MKQLVPKKEQIEYAEYTKKLEKAVLGSCVFRANANIPLATKYLRVEMFSDERNRVLFSAMMELFYNSISIDILTITDRLLKNGDLEKEPLKNGLKDLMVKVIL